MKKILITLVLTLGMGCPVLAGSDEYILWLKAEMWDGEHHIPKHTTWTPLKTYESFNNCSEGRKKAFESGWRYSQAYIQKPNIEKITQVPDRIIRLHFADGKHSTARMYQCIPEMIDPRE